MESDWLIAVDQLNNKTRQLLYQMRHIVEEEILAHNNLPVHSRSDSMGRELRILEENIHDVVTSLGIINYSVEDIGKVKPRF
jgi:hypothetical protein